MEELQKQFKRLKLKRSQLRRVFTEAVSKCQKTFEAEDFTYNDSACKEFAVAADKADRLFRIEDEVSELMYQCVQDEVEIVSEVDKTETYRDKWVTLVTIREMYTQAPAPPTRKEEGSGRSNSVTSAKRKFRLPKLELRKFDGDIKHWIGFWSLFKKIYDDDELDLDDKYQYLIQSTVEGSPARGLVDSFPPCGANFEKAVDQLKARFGRDELLIELYVRELLRLVLTQSSGKALGLRVLYDRLETQLRSLESLGVTSEKYACMLLPLAESALPDPILRLWERNRSSPSSDMAEAKDQLNELLLFLRREVEGEERLTLARETFHGDGGKSKSASDKSKKDSVQSPRVPTANDLVNIKSETKPEVCVFCGGAHRNDSCDKAKNLSVSDVFEVLKRKNRCFLCFKKGHSKPNCRSQVKCTFCSNRHASLLCRERQSEVAVEHSLSNVCLTKVLLQTIRVTLRGERDITARLIIDSGSQRSYVTKRVAQLLGYQNVKEERLIHALFGGSESTPQTHLCYKVRISSLTKDYACNFMALDTSEICAAVPIAARGPWLEELISKGIVLSDVDDGPIDILIGADIAGKLFTGNRELLKSGLVAVETLLGWTIMGRYDVETPSNALLSIGMLSTELSPSDLWRLDCLGIEDPSQTRTRQQQAQYSLENFEETVKILPTGRYEVRLPWLPSPPVLPSNMEIAKKRLNNTVQKLRNAGLEQEYHEVFMEWIKDGVIEELRDIDKGVGHYLPHRPVIKEGSTTRIRPVFDASARLKGCPSLNQCLEKGENLIDLIPSILLRFRMDQIGVISDIKKAFLQISLAEEDRDVVRFLHLDPKGNLRVFRHARVVFGVTSSPFLLGAVIQHHLKQCKKVVDSEDGFSLATLEVLEKSLYVDNCIACLPRLENVRSFIEESSYVFSKACFDLRGWEHSDSTLLEPHHTSLLGLDWERREDLIRLSLPNWENGYPEVTRRTILSTFQRIFDPIGLSAPATLVPKMLIQRTWILGGDWDSEVDSKIKEEFMAWFQEVECLGKLSINRYMVGFNQEGAEVSLHLFADASQSAFAAVVFLRIEWDGKINLFLVEAKARVAPIKIVTVPRLELLAATIGARLVNRILNEVGDVSVWCWSDSATVISWIRRDDPWGVFVFNRVNEIRKLTPTESWHHIPGIHNPADLLSRGCSPSILVQSKWWEGPCWLKKPRGEWPNVIVDVDEEEVSMERRKTAIVNLNKDRVSPSQEFTKYFSSYSRLIRHIGWMFRFVTNAKKGVRTRKTQDLRVSGDLSFAEFRHAEIRLLKIVQTEMFSDPQDRRIKRLKPRLDLDGLMRVRTKIWARKDSEDFRAPVLLAPEHRVCTMLLKYLHERNGHGRPWATQFGEREVLDRPREAGCASYCEGVHHLQETVFWGPRC